MPSNSPVLLSPDDQLYLRIIEDLNKARGDGIDAGFKTRLHEKQVECLNSLYRDKKRLIFIPCGRKFGKTELSAYVLWRQALLYPGSTCYYVVPEASQGRKLIWDNRRLQRFLGKDSDKYIDGNPNNLEMKIRFKNGSLIQVIGSENWAAANGLTPHFVVYDEFKVFNSQFHIEMDPNRAAKAAPLVIIGTMPKVGDRNKDQYEALLEYAQNNPDKAAVHRYTTFDNPINMRPDIKETIDQQIEILRARGEEDVVQREYYSRIVPGGSRAVFPMLDKVAHQKPAKELYEEIKRDLRKLEWYAVADPGTTTCFAALIVAMNPYTKKVYILDEIYEKDQHLTSVRSIYPRIEALMHKNNPGSDIHDDWIKTADEAAAWFMNEVMQQYGTYFMPTDKVHNKKEAGLSLIKDQLIHDLVVISDACPYLWKEMQEYAKDDKGNIPKKNDHLIDCFRYFNGAANYSMVEVMEAARRKADPIERDRKRSIEFDDFDRDREDWTDSVFTWE